MSLVAVGLNHQTAPVEIREQITFAPENIGDALHQMQSDLQVPEATIVSTCNRTEIYCGMPSGKTNEVVTWLHEYHKAPHDTFSPFLFTHYDRDAAQHLMRVCSGLDSMILGEPQILGQIKQAFREADESGTIGRDLSLLFQSAFNVAKQVRTDTAIGASPVSVAFAAVSLAKQIFGNLDEHTALLIGAGETVELALQHLHANNIGKTIIANRTAARAEKLATLYKSEVISLTDIPARLAEADITISSTASQLPILGKGAVEAALKARRHRPMAMIDIAVPRDIESQVSQLSDVFLYTVDDLKEIIDQGIDARQQAAVKAEHIIENRVSTFMQKIRGLDAGSTISDLRAHTQTIQQTAMDTALAMLKKGDDPEKALQYFAHTFTNKLLHTPSAQLRLASESGDTQIAESARKLFNLTESNSTIKQQRQKPDPKKHSNSPDTSND